MFSCEEKSGCHKLYSLKSKGDLAFVQATSHSARATGLQARNPLSKLSLKAIEEAVLVELKCRYETTIVARQAPPICNGCDSAGCLQASSMEI